jgi:hypothetical protein
MLIAVAFTAQLMAASAVVSPASPDTIQAPTQGRVKAIEVSDWYARRLTIHKTASYAMLPTFAFQWWAGQQIWEKGANAPKFARTGHRFGAATVATLFTANVVTGAWNLWDSRAVPEGRGRRYVHALSMMTASAGFTWAGAKLSAEAEGNREKRALHRKVALSSMAITAVSGVFMKILND